MTQPSFADRIAAIPDFPQPGILFRDVTPVLLHPPSFVECTTLLRQAASGFPGGPVQLVAGIESRGFIFGVPVAQGENLGFLPIRKPGKLPRRTVTATYQKEYGPDSLQLHADDVAPGTRVLIVDDLLATGGTALAAADLIRQAGGVVAGFLFVVELDFLKGRPKLEAVATVRSLLHY